LTSDKGNEAGQGHLRHDAVGVPGIVFFVIAAAAPLTVVVGVPGIAFGLGENIGAAGAYLLAGLVLLLFSVGYATMSRFISGPGGFAVYVARAFGPKSGAGAAFLAILSYNGFLLGVYGFFGFLAEPLFASKLGIHLDWWVWSLIALAAAGILGYRDVDLSAKVLGVLLIAEVIIVLITDFGIIFSGGDSGFNLEAFAPSNVFSGSAGVVLLFAFASFVGFEATTLYGEEAKDRKRTIPIATYVAVLAITAFYVFTFWAMGLGYGNGNVVAEATNNPGNFVFDLAGRYVGSGASDIMNWLVLSSVFAAILAFHNALSRYMFAMGRNGLLPRALGRAHGDHQSPHVASVAQSAIAAVVLAIFALAKGDPYLGLYAVFVGFGTVGILLLYTAGSLSVIGYLRMKERDNRIWHGVIAPALAAAGLLAATYLGIDNFETLTGSTQAWVNALWLLPFAAAIFGYFVGVVRYKNEDGDTGLEADLDVAAAADLPPASTSAPIEAQAAGGAGLPVEEGTP
jgi:amino acid transporter